MNVKRKQIINTVFMENNQYILKSLWMTLILIFCNVFYFTYNTILDTESLPLLPRARICNALFSLDKIIKII